MGALVVITTVGDEESGNRLAQELVARRQAACVNLIPGLKSFYRWQGKICRDSEFLLVVKTMSDEYEAVSATIRELHSYDVPEILAFNIARGDAAFLDWIAGSLDKAAPFDEEVEEELADVD